MPWGVNSYQADVWRLGEPTLGCSLQCSQSDRWVDEDQSAGPARSGFFCPSGKPDHLPNSGDHRRKDASTSNPSLPQLSPIRCN